MKMFIFTENNNHNTMIIERIDSKGIKTITLIDQHNVLFSCGMIEGQENMLGLNEERKKMDATGVFICVRGEARITIEDTAYTLKRGSLCVTFPHTVIQAFEKTDDFKGYILGGNTGFVYGMSFQSAIAVYLYIKDHPCIQLDESELQTVLAMYNQLKDSNEKTDHPFRYDILEHLLTVFCYEIAAIYHKRESMWNVTFSRKQTLFYRFLQLLMTAYQSHRNVSYYADILCITPRYLSVITKEIMGFTADECITRIVIKNARLLLTASQLSIQEVADKLNFPNPSFFGQYFKKNTGMTPKEFREQYR